MKSFEMPQSDLVQLENDVIATSTCDGWGGAICEIRVTGCETAMSADM